MVMGHLGAENRAYTYVCVCMCHENGTLLAMLFWLRGDNVTAKKLNRLTEIVLTIYMESKRNLDEEHIIVYVEICLLSNCTISDVSRGENNELTS